MSLTVKQMKGLIGSRVKISTPSKDSPTGIEFIEGVLLAAELTGVAVQASKGVKLLPIEAVYDAELVVPTRKLVRRKLKPTSQSQVRQHLIDRHGMPVDLVQSMTNDVAYMVHWKIDHRNLGHQHTAEVTGPQDSSIEYEVSDE